LIHRYGALLRNTRLRGTADPTPEAEAGARRGGQGNRGDRIGEVVGCGAHGAAVDAGGGAGHQAAPGFTDCQYRAVEGGADHFSGVQGDRALPAIGGVDRAATPAGEGGAGGLDGREEDGRASGEVEHAGGAGWIAGDPGGGAGHRAQTHAGFVESEGGFAHRGRVETSGH